MRGTKISPSSATVTLMTLLIAHTHKSNKIEQEQEVNRFFFYGYEPTDIELFPLLLNVAHS